MKLKAPLPKDFDFTAPQRFIESLGMDIEDGYKVDLNFFPGRSVFSEECKPYGVNWLVMFCVACVLDNYFDNFSNFNYFAIPGKKYRSQREGIREGLRVLFQGSVPENVSGLNTVLGASLEARASEVMEKLLKFEKGEKLEHDNKPLPTQPPEEPKKPETPQPKPPKQEKPPVPPSTEKDKEGNRPGWKNTVLKIAGILGGLGFITSLFLPGWAKQALDLVVKLLELFGQ